MEEARGVRSKKQRVNGGVRGEEDGEKSIFGRRDFFNWTPRLIGPLRVWMTT